MTASQKADALAKSVESSLVRNSLAAHVSRSGNRPPTTTRKSLLRADPKELLSRALSVDRDASQGRMLKGVELRVRQIHETLKEASTPREFARALSGIQARGLGVAVGIMGVADAARQKNREDEIKAVAYLTGLVEKKAQGFTVGARFRVKAMQGTSEERLLRNKRSRRPRSLRRWVYLRKKK